MLTVLSLHPLYACLSTRSLEHSTILYETPDLTPLLKLAWNKQDPNYLATILTDSPKAIILDIRYDRQEDDISFLLLKLISLSAVLIHIRVYWARYFYRC
jgi:hypothetical protein